MKYLRNAFKNEFAHPVEKQWKILRTNP